ncbi:transcription termination factor Rho [Striga asiatica]|uniref:Transcription termination factor Rho n=1 Tax=Striga asiatica TaxID=4170 RepID=A0A5A7QGS3_STRAF|nr:transcription termination factor Rho [Striga asiatica]
MRAPDGQYWIGPNTSESQSPPQFVKPPSPTHNTPVQTTSSQVKENHQILLLITESPENAGSYSKSSHSRIHHSTAKPLNIRNQESAKSAELTMVISEPVVPIREMSLENVKNSHVMIGSQNIRTKFWKRSSSMEGRLQGRDGTST